MSPRTIAIGPSRYPLPDHAVTLNPNPERDVWAVDLLRNAIRMRPDRIRIGCLEVENVCGAGLWRLHDLSESGIGMPTGWVPTARLVSALTWLASEYLAEIAETGA